MKKVLVGVSVLVFLIACFFNRSFIWMKKIAEDEYSNYRQEYGVDSTGFVGPMLSLDELGGLLFVWENKRDDTTSASIRIHVYSRRFSETIVGTKGSKEYWGELRKR